MELHENLITSLSDRIHYLMKLEGLTSNDSFMKATGTTNLSRIIAAGAMSDAFANRVCKSLEVEKEWLLYGTGPIFQHGKIESRRAQLELIADKTVRFSNGEDDMQVSGGIPFYDVDFALGYDEMYNDTPNVPTKLISIPGYEKADFWCRASGDSMKPVINNGDIIALKVVEDWQSFLPMNEVYAIMTTNDLRTVKVVRKGSDEAHFTLHAYNEEFEDQEIPKSAITKIFKVLGSLKAI